MGKLMRLRGVRFTDTTGPKIITRDKIESSGSLFLFDGNHEYGKFNGLPERLGVIPNVLANLSSSLIGVGESQTHFIVNQATFNTAGVFLRERTQKGGIHGLITQAGGQVSQMAYAVNGSDAVRNYMRDNPAHKFYVSLWQRVTRKSLSTSAPQAPFFYTNSSAATSNFRFHMEGSLPSPRIGTAPSLGARAVPVENDSNIASGTNRFTSLGVKGATGNEPAGSDPVQLVVGTASAWAGGSLNKAASRIIYRAYVEDLTVSGRSYAEVEAIDYALYQEAFAPGGKFYGDTYTNPSTLP